MIKINVLRSLQGQKDHDALIKLTGAYLEERTKKSFSERHLELGKMINCSVCDRRHREARTCVPTYATKMQIVTRSNGEQVVEAKTIVDAEGNRGPDLMLASQHTAKGVMGAACFKGRRNKHRNAWGLQVLERATKIFSEDRSFYKEMTEDEEAKLGKMSLSRALNEKRKERAARRRNLFVITRESRRINQSL